MQGRILFLSLNLGLGHVIRDLAIVNEMRQRESNLEIFWLATHPATLELETAREKLLPEADQLPDPNAHYEKTAKGGRIDINTLIGIWKKGLSPRFDIFKHVINKYQFDLVVGDETFIISHELCRAFRENRPILKVPFVMIYDCIKYYAMTDNPLESLIVESNNQSWTKLYRDVPDTVVTKLFVGELEDVPNEPLGEGGPNARHYVMEERYNILKYIVSFNPAEYKDKTKIRAKLGYSEEPLVVCALGGTAIGKEMLELCSQAYPLIKELVPELHMVLVCGPRLSPRTLLIQQGVEVRGYVPNLHEHFAASDLAIVQGGGHTTIELMALRRPFLFFPLENHFEQQVHVERRVARYKAGVKMSYSETTPEALCEQVVANLGKELTYPPIPTDGAQKAARIILRLLE